MKMRWAMTQAFETRIGAIAATAQLVLPDGPGPFPLVVQMHGCGGSSPNQLRWAQISRSAGCAALILDSYAFRRIGTTQAIATICTGLRLHGRERAGDLFGALAWARAQPWADPERLCAIGWSHGGWSILDALAMGPAQYGPATRLSNLPAAPLAGLRGAFVLYPYLGRAALAARQKLSHPARVEAIVCGRDRTVGARVPLAALERLRNAGANLEAHFFAHCTHDFDEPDRRTPGMRHDEAAIARAQGLFREFLLTHIVTGQVRPAGAQSHP